MSFLYAIDPGVHMCGIAVFDDTRLISAFYGKLPEDGNYSTCELIIEMPRIYPGSGQQKGDLNDLLNLAAVVGHNEALFSALRSRRVFPAQWKGQVPKKAMNQRILKRLSLFEAARIQSAGAKSHNVIDAVGIGLFACGRLK